VDTKVVVLVDKCILEIHMCIRSMYRYVHIPNADTRLSVVRRSGMRKRSYFWPLGSVFWRSLCGIAEANSIPGVLQCVLQYALHCVGVCVATTCIFFFCGIA